jgi:hypothetical protein
MGQRESRVELGQEIGVGTGGSVFTVRGNRSLVVKLPHCALYGRRRSEHRCGRQIKPDTKIFNEIQIYHDLKHVTVNLL